MGDHKRTLLYNWHVENGANMAPFGEYEMPLWYPEGVKAEHLAVISGGGIFDTSHMASVTVAGSDARQLLQYCFSKDLERCIGVKKSPLVAGRCAYGVFLNEDGTVLDDAIVSQLENDRYMVVVNAGMGAEIAARLKEFAADRDAAITDLTDRIGKMDIQGPVSAKVMAELLAESEQVLDKFPYFSFKGGFAEVGFSSEVKLADGTPILLSRTGYTGEFGFEIFVASEHFIRVWESVYAAGKKYGVLPCGLAARDSLRAGSVLPLSHQDIGPWPFINNPWPFALPFDDEQKAFTKDFHGGGALLDAKDSPVTLPFAGFNPRKIVVSDSTYVMNESGENIGTILTCATDMAIDRVDGEIFSIASPVEDGRPAEFSPKGLSCGFVKINKRLSPGSRVILTDGKRKKIEVEIRSDVRPFRSARRPLKDMV